MITVKKRYKFTSATETDINDLFWFENEMLCEWLGIDYEEDYLAR